MLLWYIPRDSIKLLWELSHIPFTHQKNFGGASILLGPVLSARDGEEEELGTDRPSNYLQDGREQAYDT